MFLSDSFKDNLPKFDLLVFDVDGVLVDTSRSFPYAISNAIKQYGKIMGYSDWQAPTYEMISEFKSMSGFNNDWDLEEALAIFYLQARILDNSLSFPEYLSTIDKFGGGLSGVHTWTSTLRNGERKEIQEVFRPDLIRHLAMEHYAGEKHCESFYGICPRFGVKTCALENETILVDLKLLHQLPMTKGIYTGRNEKEFEFVSQRLGNQFWHPECVVCDNGKSSVKPDPLPLYSMAKTGGSNGLIYIGDSRDDRITIERFRKEYPEISAEFVQVLNGAMPFDHEFSFVEEVNGLLKFLAERFAENPLPSS
jgi:phosphoglycolate phosphatase-like HAD superfamily hydrolase